MLVLPKVQLAAGDTTRGQVRRIARDNLGLSHEGLDPRGDDVKIRRSGRAETARGKWVRHHDCGQLMDALGHAAADWPTPEGCKALDEGAGGGLWAQDVPDARTGQVGILGEQVERFGGIGPGDPELLREGAEGAKADLWIEDGGEVWGWGRAGAPGGQGVSDAEDQVILDLSAEEEGLCGS